MTLRSSLLPTLLASGLLVAAFAAGGCSPELGDAPFFCNPGAPRCPSGYICNAANICIPEDRCPVGIPGCGQPPPPGCGDGTCDAPGGETCTNCEADCGKCQKGCGNAICEVGEDCTNCAQDCGNCPTICGDKKCEGAENAQTCPQDCSPTQCGNNICEAGETQANCPADCKGTQPVCGNGKCESPETATSCPADCGGGGCTQDDTRCKDADTLEYCENNVWQPDTCLNICTSNNYDYTTGCQLSTQTSEYVCICGRYSSFGDVCDGTAKCQTGLICASYGGTQGFCTKNCSNVGGLCSGAPWGTMAECSTDTIGGKNVCVFACDFFTDCPQDLYCSDPFSGGYCEP